MAKNLFPLISAHFPNFPKLTYFRFFSAGKSGWPYKNVSNSPIFHCAVICRRPSRADSPVPFAARSTSGLTSWRSRLWGTHPQATLRAVLDAMQRDPLAAYAAPHGPVPLPPAGRPRYRAGRSGPYVVHPPQPARFYWLLVVCTRKHIPQP